MMQLRRAAEFCGNSRRQLLLLRQRVRFEGQGAMELEFALEDVKTETAYNLPLNSPLGHETSPTWRVGWEDLVKSLVQDAEAGISAGLISAKFHNALARVIIDVARKIGESKVVLTGGCFQNRYLTEHAVQALREAGFRPYWHQRIPPNDGGIALGQVVAAALRNDQLAQSTLKINSPHG